MTTQRSDESLSERLLRPGLNLEGFRDRGEDKIGVTHGCQVDEDGAIREGIKRFAGDFQCQSRLANAAGASQGEQSACPNPTAAPPPRPSR